jgi:intracellular multiplication protein IcmD
MSQIKMKTVLLALGTAASLYAGHAFAAMDIGTVATNITGTFAGIAKLITAMAYVAGMAFALAAVMKFKQHKDNPTQIPIGTPIALVFIAAALIFLPTIFGIAGQTLFGGTQTAGGVTGVVTFS